MSSIAKIFGAKALIYLKTNLDIQELSEVLAKGLMLTGIDLEADEYPPHEVSGSCEALGFELWLEQSTDILGLPYLLKIETEDCLSESFKDQMHDLSPWLARYVSKICEIDSFIPYTEDHKGLLFTKGEASEVDIHDLIE